MFDHFQFNVSFPVDQNNISCSLFRKILVVWYYNQWFFSVLGWPQNISCVLSARNNLGQDFSGAQHLLEFYLV